MRILPFPATSFIWLFCTLTIHAETWRLTVEAGDFDRRETLVPFSAPAGMRGDYLLSDAAGQKRPLQVEADGRACFVEPDLKRGASKTYTLAKVSDLPTVVTPTKEGAILKITAQPGDRPIVWYQTEPGPVPAGTPEIFRHGAHLHPVFTPSGQVVTANHPLDHPHQRGIWMAWTKTEFEGRHPDFWNMGKEDGGLTGEVRFANLQRNWSGIVQGGFISHHRFVDHTSGLEKDVLKETWEVVATPLPKAFLIDFTSTQATADEIPLKLPQYHYGGFGVRGSAVWDPVDKVTMLTSNGDNRKSGDNTTAKWAYLGGAVEGEPAGIAILIHPNNFRFPQPLRLNPKNPQLCVAPSQDGDWEILPGHPSISRYRLVVADGAPDQAAIENQWNDYAYPPTVTVRKE